MRKRNVPKRSHPWKTYGLKVFAAKSPSERDIAAYNAEIVMLKERHLINRHCRNMRGIGGNRRIKIK